MTARERVREYRDAERAPLRRYHVREYGSGATVGFASTLSGARRSRDRRDLDYGAVRFYVYDPIDGRIVL